MAYTIKWTGILIMIVALLLAFSEIDLIVALATLFGLSAIVVSIVGVGSHLSSKLDEIKRLL